MSVTLVSPFAALPAALLAGVLLALLIVRLGRGEVPAGLLGAGLSLGVVMGTLILVLEAPFRLQANVYGFSPLAVAFGFAGFPEEAAKMAAVIFFLRPHYLRRSPRALVVGAAMAALGFALFENVLFVAAAGQQWGTLALTRAVTAVPVHVFLGIVGVLAIARAEFAGSRLRAGLGIAVAWVVVSILHGSYDLPVILLKGRPPYPAFIGAAAGALGVSAATALYALLLSATTCLCLFAFLALRALDQPPFPAFDREAPPRLAFQSGFGRVLLAPATGLVAASSLLVSSFIALALSAIASVVVDDASLTLVAAIHVVCPVTVGLALLWFRPRVRAKSSPVQRRRRLAVAALVAALVVFGGYRWGAGPVRDIIAMRIEVKGLQSEVKGDHQAAIHEYDKALAIAPDLVDALAKRAGSNYGLERYDLALSDLDKAVLLQPRNVALLLQRSEVHRAMHATASVVADIDRALAIAPKNPGVWAASAQADMEARDTVKASADIARAIELGAHDAATLKTQGLLFANAGDYDGALRALDEELRTNSADVDGLFLRGRVRFYNGEMGLAATDFANASERENNLYPALWLFLVRSRAGVDGGPELAARTIRLGNYKWPSPVVRFFLGQMSAADVRAEAANDEQRCEADFYGAEVLLGQARTEPATAGFRRAVDECPLSYVEYEGAKAELRKLGSGASPQPSPDVAAPVDAEAKPAVTPQLPARGDAASGDAEESDTQKVVASGAARAWIADREKSYAGQVVWSFVERETSGSELDAVLVFPDPTVHGELRLKRAQSAGGPEYELVFNILASDLPFPPFSDLGTPLRTPLVDTRGTRLTMPSISRFERVNEASYRMRIAAEDIDWVLSDLALGQRITIQNDPAQVSPLTLTFELNRDSSRVLQLAASAWR